MDVGDGRPARCVGRPLDVVADPPGAGPGAPVAAHPGRWRSGTAAGQADQMGAAGCAAVSVAATGAARNELPGW